MNAVTDYKEWLDAEGIESATDLLQVYRPVNNNESGWIYQVVPARGNGANVIVTGGQNDLVLTGKSRIAFIKYMDSLYELGVEGQAMLEHAMTKND